jgi:hypothetical protein
MRARVMALLTLGLLQMTGEALHVKPLQALAAATGASPAPKVFSAVHGLETYSSEFFVEWTDRSGVFHSVRISPERAAKMRGPYNRRNVYGAVLAYGPVMRTNEATRPMFESVSRYALCGKAPLLRESGIPVEDVQGKVRIRVETRGGTKTGNLPLEYEPSCE